MDAERPDRVCRWSLSPPSATLAEPEVAFHVEHVVYDGPVRAQILVQLGRYGVRTAEAATHGMERP